jgi:signal transduction histidine kinase
MLGLVKLLDLGAQAAGGRADSDVRRSPGPVLTGPGRAGDEGLTAVTAAGFRPFAAAGRRPASGRVPRLTVRMRLALAYGALFLLCGTALLGVSYVLVASFPIGATVHLTSPSNIRSSPGSRGSNTVRLASPRRHGTTSQGSPKTGPPGFRPVPPGAVDAAQNAQRSADLHSLLVWFGVALGAMATLSVIAGWLMAGRVLRPLRQITAAARHISEENLHQRLALAGPSDEITDLAGTIDGLLARLEGAFDAQQAFVANASHELRTPLAMMRTSLDVAAAKCPPISQDASVLSAKVREGLEQAERLVESFLVLARAQRGVVDDLTTVSLPQITADTLDNRTDRAAAASVTLRRSLDPAEVAGSQTLLSRLAANLTDNAIRYNQPGGWVQVTTTAGGSSARLTVENSGPVLHPREASQLGRPFRRGGAERTCSDGGVGLGLSIVAAIAAAHRGSIDIEARTAGGLRVTVTLPRLAAPGQDHGVP